MLRHPVMASPAVDADVVALLSEVRLLPSDEAEASVLTVPLMSVAVVLRLPAVVPAWSVDWALETGEGGVDARGLSFAQPPAIIVATKVAVKIHLSVIMKYLALV